METIVFFSAIFLIFFAVSYILRDIQKKRSIKTRQCAFEIQNEITRLVEAHKNELVEKKHRLVYIGDYGEICDEEYKEELNYFLKSIVYPEINDQFKLCGQLPDAYLHQVLIYNLIDEIDQHIKAETVKTMQNA